MRLWLSLWTVYLSHGIWPRPRLGLRTVGLAHGIWTKPRLAREPDELSISHEVVPLVCANAVSPSRGVGDEPVRVPDLGDRVLHNYSVSELERPAHELGTFFFDFFGIFEPFLHVTG